MASEKIISEVSSPTFYTRVAFLALKTAQQVAAESPGTANHVNRVAYASRVLRGEDNALGLALHLVSSNGTITNTVDTQGGASVPDSDLEFALATIWDARSNAFAA